MKSQNIQDVVEEINYETRDYDGIRWIRYDHHLHALTQYHQDLMSEVSKGERNRIIFEVRGLMKVSRTEWEAMDKLLNELSNEPLSNH